MCLLVLFAGIIVTLFLATVRYLNVEIYWKEIEYDMLMVTAADYSVEMKINFEAYYNWH